MSFQDIVDKIEAHPFVGAIALFLIVFVVTYVLRKKSTVAATTAVTAAVAAPLTPPDVVNNTFNSYPVSQVTVPPVVGNCPQGSTFVASTTGVIPTGATPTNGGYCVPNSTVINKPPTPTPIPVPKPPPPTPTPKPPPTPIPVTSIHPAPWPEPTSTLSGIASHYRVSLQQIEAWNQWIFNERHTWNLIYPSDTIRVA